MTSPPSPPLRRDANLVLGIETATALGGVALVSPSGILGEITLLNPESHSERILPAAERLFLTLGLGLRDLAAVAVSCGPGSFTGLRTGIASAKGLAFSLGIALYGIPTLEALAAGVPPGAGPVCALLNARRGESFRAVFHRGACGPVAASAEAVVSHSRLLADLPGGCLVVGDVPALPRELAAAGRNDLFFAPPALNHPRSAVIALLGLAGLQAGRPSELSALQPRYLRPSDAEARICAR